jgi:hypothetical protein
MKKIFLLFFVSHFALAQNRKGQFEITAPLNPWTLLTSSYFLQGEYNNSKIRSTTATLGYQGTAFYFSYFSKVKKMTGYRADIGQRWYLSNKIDKYVRPFGGINLSAEYSNYSLKSGFNVPEDSLNTKGLSIGPEINAGVKFVILKRLTITPALGLRYYVNTHKSQKITQNPSYWAYDDWDNGSLTWQDNRRTIESFRKGFLPIPYLNLGFVVKL